MSEQRRDCVTWFELLIVVVFLFILITSVSFINWKDTRELQFRVGQIENERR